MTLEVFPLWMLHRNFEVPVGTIVMWPAIEPAAASDSKVPTGWKICDGSSLSRSEYQDLWNTIRLTYTSSDNNSTFNLPDLTNIFVRGTNPDYNISSNTYSWDPNKYSGIKQGEEFKHSMIRPTVTPNVSISTYQAGVSYQIKTKNDEVHSHSDAVPEGYKFTTIDDANEQTAGHDWANLDNFVTVSASHLPARRRTSGDENTSYPYGTFYDSFGDPDGHHSLSFQKPERWVHSHPDHTLQSSNASEGIIGYNASGSWNNQNTEFAVGQTSIAWNQNSRNVPLIPFSFVNKVPRRAGFIDFSDPKKSNLTVETGNDYTQRWEIRFAGARSGYPIDAGVVNKGGTNYLIVMTSNGPTNGYPKDMNPMRSANMVMCNIDAHPDLDVWTRVNGQNLSWMHSNWYLDDPANGYDADGNSVPASYTDRNTRRLSRLVVCKANNAATVWQSVRDNEYDGGIYRDYVNSPSEAPHSGYWGKAMDDPFRSGSFTTDGLVREYASSETSTIVVTDVDSYWLTRGGDSLNKVLRTTDGYNYSVSGMSAFPNQGVGFIDDDEEYRNYYWRARTIAYGNGVWVIGRDNLGITFGGYGDQDTRYSIIHSTDDGLTWNIGNTYLQKTNTTGNVWGVEFGNGIFMANTFHGDTSTPYLYTSTDGANWTKIEPTYNGGSWRFFDSPNENTSNITYGNGMFVINYFGRIRVGSSSIVTVNGLYSTDNGQNWQSFDGVDDINNPETHIRFVEGADIFLAADPSSADDRRDRLVGMESLYGDIPEQEDPPEGPSQQSQGQLNSQGYNIQTWNQENGQLLSQPSVGDHTHQFTYSIDRTHSHEVTGQSGELQISGLDDKIEPKHIPMLYIIYTGVI